MVPYSFEELLSFGFHRVLVNFMNNLFYILYNDFVAYISLNLLI